MLTGLNKKMNVTLAYRSGTKRTPHIRHFHQKENCFHR